MKRLPFDKAQIERICEEFPTPFHIYDAQGIRENVRRLRRAFAWNPGFREYFAVKALPNPVIMQLLHEEGCGMDCSSLTELMLARAVGIAGHEIMFSSNDTPPEEFELARELDALVNLDDITHIDFCAAMAASRAPSPAATTRAGRSGSAIRSWVSRARPSTASPARS